MNLRLKYKTLDPALRKQLLSKRWPSNREYNKELNEYVLGLIAEVKARGDTAIVELTKGYDGVEMSPKDIKVTSEDIEQAYENVGTKFVSAIESAKNYIEPFQREILNRLGFEFKTANIRIRTCIKPIDRLGLYVPGGMTAYPSSLLMMAVPAKVASVPEVMVCSPPGKDGKANPLILVTADVCDIHEIYKVGGVQAVAAMAYGTVTIPPVHKIMGPGNKYVQAAKMLVSRDVYIDAPAGPSEIIVLADHNSDPMLIALDLISQAEHAEGFSILVTPCLKLAKMVANQIEDMLNDLSNSQMIARNLSKKGLLLVSKDMTEAIGFINQFAPEHLEIISDNSWCLAEKITSTGLVLVGSNTPVAASDYCIGTNHVLPTGGFSKVYSGLSVIDFVKRHNIVECSKEGLRNVQKTSIVLAESEGLYNHALAVQGRFKDVKA